MRVLPEGEWGKRAQSADGNGGRGTKERFPRDSRMFPDRKTRSDHRYQLSRRYPSVIRTLSWRYPPRRPRPLGPSTRRNVSSPFISEPFNRRADPRTLSTPCVIRRFPCCLILLERRRLRDSHLLTLPTPSTVFAPKIRKLVRFIAWNQRLTAAIPNSKLSL